MADGNTQVPITESPRVDKDTRADDMEIVIWQAGGGLTGPIQEKDQLSTAQFEKYFKSRSGVHFVIKNVERHPRERDKWTITFSEHSLKNGK
jgi:hypothetical protein